MRKIMIKTLLFGVLTLVLISAFAMPKAEFTAVGETPLQDTVDSEQPVENIQEGPCHMSNTTFQGGEELVYKLFYNWNFVWIPAGEVVFKVTETEDQQYHFNAAGRTYTSYDWAFKVRDNYEVYCDKEDLLPSLSIRQVKEGGYSLFDKMTFDQNNQKITSLRGKTKDQAIVREFDLDNCMHDVLSVIYYARNIDFENYQSGQEFPIQVFMDKEVWPLKVRYQNKEAATRVKGLGKFNTIKFTPEVIVGDVFTEQSKMNVYVSDDNNRIPLLIESPISVGSVKAVLKEYKGLKYDLSSQVK